ncbi:MAG: hypothetical protein H0W72_05680 [Planctomycetes bacterium]|nr:hypothetical protein [Planctomycetota bacterium]
MLRIAPVVFVLLLFVTGCAPRDTPAPSQVIVLRHYGWETTVPDPEAEWNPTSYQVLVRAAGGFALLEEGQGHQGYFNSLEKRSMHDASWVNGYEFVFGPADNVVRIPDGSIVPNTDGLTVVAMRAAQPTETRLLSRSGWRPRLWRDRIVAQIEDRIVLIDSAGTMNDFVPGFLPEPQRHGPGICFQQTPVLEEDHWTAKPRLGALVVRWQPARISGIPAAIQPAWTADGGVVAVQLGSEPAADAPWWRVPTKLVHLAGPNAAPVVVASDMHDPAPHPTLPMVAATDRDGRLVLIDLRGRPQAVLAEIGERPRWSGDGQRLLVEEPLQVAPKPDQTPAHAQALADQGRYVHVYVLKLGT